MAVATTQQLSGGVVVTGAGSGIGRAAALAAAERGASVAVLDIDASNASTVAKEATTRGAPSAIGLPCDVRDEDSVASAIGTAVDEIGPIRGLVTSAGIERHSLAHELSASEWFDVLNTNLSGTFFACKHALVAMLAHGQGGSIVCVSSPLAEVSIPGGFAAYSASKGGVSALVRSMALDYAPRGIRVNAIVPGATETPLMWMATPPDEVPAARAAVESHLAMGRMARPEEIAAGIGWLLSDEAVYAVGSHLVIDGGLLARCVIDS
jgi:NAD(P)-dependent dehydrogenase (short-subunit alcohol dehydrogenase family)